MEVNETKLLNALHARELRPARPDELQAAGIVAGYASPIGVKGVTVVVDDLVEQSPNLVAGANRVGYHLRNTNYGRDYTADIVADIVAAEEGAPCPRCGSPVRMVRGVEVGNIFKLGTKYTKALDATYVDEQGESHHIVMGSYGIGVGRLMGCVAHGMRDDNGLIWPVSIAPYHVYLAGLDLSDPAINAAAEQLYRDLEAAGVEVLYDDRDERAGVKFKDADLLGMPIRVTISRRTMQNTAVEFKLRAGGEARQIALDSAVAEVVETLNGLRAAIAATVVPEVFTTNDE
jgi:prolyl-tRNA synthetase